MDIQRTGLVAIPLSISSPDILLSKGAGYIKHSALF